MYIHTYAYTYIGHKGYTCMFGCVHACTTHAYHMYGVHVYVCMHAYVCIHALTGIPVIFFYVFNTRS